MNRPRVLCLAAACVFCIGADAAQIPQTAAELWADFPALDKATPLDTEVLRSWELKGIQLHLVRFTVGVFQGQTLKLAGIYAHPKGGKHLPALVQCHGGGQRTSVGGIAVAIVEEVQDHALLL